MPLELLILFPVVLFTIWLNVHTKPWYKRMTHSVYVFTVKVIMFANAIVGLLCMLIIVACMIAIEDDL